MQQSLEHKFAELLGGIKTGAEDPALAALAGPDLASVARRTGWLSLVLFPGVASTKVSLYNGLTLVARDEVHVQPGVMDDEDSRFEHVLAWMVAQGVRPAELSGIAARGGFIAPVTTGTYEVCDEMIEDLEAAPHWHASNMSIPIASRIAQLAGRDTVVTTTDPVTCDEVDPVYRMTGSPQLRTDGTAIHYLDIRATCRLTAKLLGQDEDAVHLATWHLGGGISGARYQKSRIVQTVAAFGNVPSMARAGRLPLMDVLVQLESRKMTLQALKHQVMESDAGLLGLAGTDDFQAFLAFRDAGATKAQREKIDLITDFYATRIAAGLMEMAACDTPLDAVVVTGGIAKSELFIDAVRNKVHLPVPVVRVPGSFEMQGLATGLLRVCADSERAKDYVEEKRAVAQARQTDARRMAETIFSRPVLRRAEGSPITSFDDIISAAMPKGDIPTVAIVGADNEEALLAAKTASSEGTYRMARFVLIGPYARVSALAWELDIPIDEENYYLLDSTDPVEDAKRLYHEGAVDIMMKGSVTTASMLKGYFASLKAAGRLAKGSILSHIGLFEIPGRTKLVALTDAAINPNPDLKTRKAIVENGVKALHALGIKKPKVALVSSIEKPSHKVLSSVEGRELAEHFMYRDDMIVEGPISFDLALSIEAVKDKDYKGKIQGDADLLVVPMIDVGNVVYKSFTITGGAVAAGAVIGGEAPLILTSRGDSARTKLSSIALALLLERKNKREQAK